MRPLPLLLVVALRLLCITAPASAQTVDEYAAWGALIRSPIGGVLSAPSASQDASTSRRSLSLNRGTWSFGPGDDETSNVSATLEFPAGRVAIVLQGMVTSVKDCSECGGNVLGGGLIYALNSVRFGGADGARLDIAINPAAHLGSFSDGEASTVTAAVSVPVSLSVPIGPVTFRPFLTPGYGYGRVTADTETYGATRALFGYGLALASKSGRLQAHVGTMEVRLEEAPTVTAMGLTLRF
jgi:hypothetical protein